MTDAFKATGKPNDQVWTSKLNARDPKSPHYVPPNAALVNTAIKAAGHPLRSIGLWVTDISTGWTLNGSTAQTQKSQIFYPHNLSQNPLTVVGQMASQYEYDKLVEFVIQHRLNAIGHGGEQGPLSFFLPERQILGMDGKPIIDRNGLPKLRYKRMHIDGYIEQMAAGHKRFVYQPTFTFNMMVTRDHDKDGTEDLPGIMNSTLESVYRKALFGDLLVVPNDDRTVVGREPRTSYWLGQDRSGDG